MSRHFKVSEFLATRTPEERAEYDAIVRDSRTTVDDAHAWLLEHGYDGSRHSAANHKKRNFDDVLKDVRARAEMAAAIGRVAREKGAGTIRDAALACFEQRLMDLVEDSEITIKDAATIALTFQRVGLAAWRNETALKKAVEEASKVARSGGDGASVVATMQRVLGLTEDAPAKGPETQ